MTYFLVFLYCVACGAASGTIYDVFYILRVWLFGADKSGYGVPEKIFTAVCDILYFAALTFSYVFMSVVLNFPDLRLFMIMGCALGVIIYLKSFHIILAFFVKKVYNKINKRRKCRERKR